MKKLRPSRGDIIRRVSAMVFFLQKAPRTASELGGLIDMTAEQTRKWLICFEGEGLVEKSGMRPTRTVKAPEYRWIRQE